MNNFDQFEALSETEIAAINGGGLFDGLNSALTGLGSALAGLGAVGAGAGSALALAGVGVTGLLSSASQAVTTLSGSIANLLAGLKITL